MRAIIITADGKDTYEMRFDAELVTDSEALHSLLIRIDPGDEYNVKFTNALSAIKGFGEIKTEMNAACTDMENKQKPE